MRAGRRKQAESCRVYKLYPISARLSAPRALLNAARARVGSGSAFVQVPLTVCLFII